MSLYTDINFSGNLIQNESTIITYSGSLFKNNSESVTIVYGFGNNWSNTTEQLMQKTETGFTAKIELLNFDKFNFCFRNSNYIWDNNNNQNYTAPISEPQFEEAFILNENIIGGILENLFEYDLSEFEDDTKTQLTDTTSSTTAETEFFIDIEKKEPISIEDSIVNVTEESDLANDIETIFNDIYVNATSDVTEETLDNNPVELSQSNTSEFNMNDLIDEILSPIVQSSTFEETNFSSPVHIETESDTTNNSLDTLINDLYENISSVTPPAFDMLDDISFETIDTVSETEAPLMDALTESTTESNNQTALLEIENSDSFLVSPRSLSKFYLFKKKVKLAFYKLFVSIPKILSGSTSKESNK